MSTVFEIWPRAFSRCHSAGYSLDGYSGITTWHNASYQYMIVTAMILATFWQFQNFKILNFYFFDDVTRFSSLSLYPLPTKNFNFFCSILEMHQLLSDIQKIKKVIFL